MRQPVQITAKGRCLLPDFRCIAPVGERWTGGLDAAEALYSDDQGQSRQAAKAPDSLGAVHMNPLPPLDGLAPAMYRSRRSRSSTAACRWMTMKAGVRHRRAIKYVRIALT